MHDFSQAAVIGTGMMGPGIALTLALGGVRATILSRTGEGARRGLESAMAQGRLLEEHGLIECTLAAAARERLRTGTDFDGTVATADLVIESAPESMDFKKSLFAHLDAVARPDAVLASNTSGLSITEIASACRHPERVITTHFWNPPHLMPLVEIVRGDRTAPEIPAAVRALLERCGKTPVVVKKDRRGQLGNRLQMALVREAAYMIAEGIADAEDIDAAIRATFGLRFPVYGLLEHMDVVGFEIAYAVADYVAGDLCNDRHGPGIMREMMARGENGARSGKGFYDWSKKDLNEVRARRDAFALEFLKRPRAIPEPS
jgi:3-hydroxybutyryl-CoA dehydrogenase